MTGFWGPGVFTLGGLCHVICRLALCIAAGGAGWWGPAAGGDGAEWKTESCGKPVETIVDKLQGGQWAAVAQGRAGDGGFEGG